jgi:hypothetical protein
MDAHLTSISDPVAHDVFYPKDEEIYHRVSLEGETSTLADSLETESRDSTLVEDEDVKVYHLEEVRDAQEVHDLEVETLPVVGGSFGEFALLIFFDGGTDVNERERGKL